MSKGTVVVDVHEPDNMSMYLRDLDWRVKQEALEVGDYVRGDSCIERKEINDFVNSLKGGRVFKQVINMKDNYEACYLLVSGSISEIRNWKLENSFLSSMATISRLPVGEEKKGLGVPVLRAENDRDLTRLISVLLEDKDESTRPSRVTRKSKSLSMMQEDVLCGIRGVGVKTAKDILAHFGSIKQLVNTPEDKIVEVKGVGSATARKINKVLREEYND